MTVQLGKPHSMQEAHRAIFEQGLVQTIGDNFFFDAITKSFTIEHGSFIFEQITRGNPVR